MLADRAVATLSDDWAEAARSSTACSPALRSKRPPAGDAGPSLRHYPRVNPRLSVPRLAGVALSPRNRNAHAEPMPVSCGRLPSCLIHVACASHKIKALYPRPGALWEAKREPTSEDP